MSVRERETQPARVTDVRALQVPWTGGEDSDTGCMATAANQLFQELLGDHPQVLSTGPGSSAGWGGPNET